MKEITDGGMWLNYRKCHTKEINVENVILNGINQHIHTHKSTYDTSMIPLACEIRIGKFLNRDSGLEIAIVWEKREV